MKFTITNTGVFDVNMTFTKKNFGLKRNITEGRGLASLGILNSIDRKFRYG